MQSFFSIEYIAKRLGMTLQSVIDSMAALNQEPVMTVDDKKYYSADSAAFLEKEAKREERIRYLEKQIGYSELNAILYPDGSGALDQYGPLERFVNYIGERPRKDYTAELQKFMDNNERTWVANKAWQAERYWEDVEALKESIQRGKQ